MEALRCRYRLCRGSLRAMMPLGVYRWRVRLLAEKKSFAEASYEFNLHRMLKLALIERLDLANRIHGKCV